MNNEWKEKEKLKKSVKAFEKTIVKLPFKNYIDSKNISDNKEFCRDALYQGYLDACRTFNGQKKIKQNDSILLKIAEDMQEYLFDKKAECFDKKHKEWCHHLKEFYKMKSYGQAQKIVNMSFKYMYCFFYRKEQCEVDLKKFNPCHMPLDYFSLEWLKRCLKAKGEKLDIKVDAWSKLDLADYNECCRRIKELLEGTNFTPLQLDFYVWPKMQIILSAETFMKNFNIEVPDNPSQRKHSGSRYEETSGYELKILDETLKKKLDEVKQKIDDSGFCDYQNET